MMCSSRFPGSLRTIFLTLILTGALATAVTVTGDDHSRAEVSSTFVATNVLNQPGGSLAGGIALGDPDNDGEKEVIVAGGSAEAGRVTVVDYNESTERWDTPTIWVDSQALVEVISADIDPYSEGEELIAGGYSRNLTVLYWPGGTGATRDNQIDTLPLQIFGMTAGDFNGSHPGLELAVVDGKSENLTIYQSGGAKHLWEKHTLMLNESLRNVKSGDYDPSHPGEELVVLSSNGSVFSILNNNGMWETEWVWSDTDKLLDAAIGDADSRYSGKEIITVGLSRHATMLRKTTAGEWAVEHLWTAPGGLEGLDIGEFDPSHSGLEIAIGGYSRTVVMLYLDVTQWRAKEIYQDKESSQSELNGVAIGEFYSAHKAPELMVVGASGVTTLLEYEHPDFTLSTGSTLKTVDAGDEAVYTIVVGKVSSFQGDIELEAESPLDIILSDEVVSAPGTSTLTVRTEKTTLNGDYVINITGKYSDDVKILSLLVRVESSERPDFTLNLSTAVIELERHPTTGKADLDNEVYSGEITVKIDSIHGFDSGVKLAVSGLPENFEYVTSIETVYPGEDSLVNIRIVSNPPEDTDEFTFTLTGSSGDITHLEVVTIKLLPATIKNGDDTDDTAEWVPLARNILIVIIIILFVIILLLRVYRSRSGKISDEKDKKD